MPPIDITNPKVIRFLNETYEKEANIRFFWNNKNKEKIECASTLKREFKNYYDLDIFERTMMAGMAATTQDHVAAARYRFVRQNRDGNQVYGIKDIREGHSIVNMGLGTPEEDPRLARPKDFLETDPIMRPVEPKLTEIIYGHQPGRLEYLDKRARVFPEKKYYFAECVSWDCGWRMKDSQLKQPPRRGIRCTLTNTYKTNRVGPQPDPPHYKSSVPPGVSKFNDL